jgi:hypothetical protein
MNTDDVVENIVSPLYLRASGATIDRIRAQTYRFLDSAADKEISMAYMGEEHELAFSPAVQDLRALQKDQVLMSTLGEMSPDMVVSIVCLASEAYVKMNPNSGRSLAEVTPELDMVALGLLRLYELKCGPLNFDAPGTPLLGAISYRNIGGGNSAVFFGLNKRAGQPH